MNLNIKTMSPYVEDLISQTQSGQYKWENMGNDSYCLVAGDFSYTIKRKSNSLLPGLQQQVVFQFFDKRSCIFEYTTSILLTDNEFNKLLVNLADIIDSKYAEMLQEKALQAMKLLQSKSKKS